jgi:hypothetical protein
MCQTVCQLEWQQTTLMELMYKDQNAGANNLHKYGNDSVHMYSTGVNTFSNALFAILHNSLALIFLSTDATVQSPKLFSLTFRYIFTTSKNV